MQSYSTLSLCVQLFLVRVSIFDSVNYSHVSVIETQNKKSPRRSNVTKDILENSVFFFFFFSEGLGLKFVQE